jgi:hypothetical protein
VKLSREEFIKLVTWVDANVPFYGSYFGMRNIASQKHPAFRPVPTLASARGVPPEPFTLKPIAASLLAHLPLNGPTAVAAGNEPDAVRVTPSAGIEFVPTDQGSRAIRFDGADYVAVGALGDREAVSVSLWVNPSATPNRWNPLLFTDGGDRGAFHFSLLDDGTPNVAVNSGERQWSHRHANAPLPVERWSHLVVTCDPRYGGSIAFYIDGQEDSQHPFDLGVPLNLSSFRLGAWKSWENNPKAGFHGLVDEVQIYQGSLTEREVADLFAAGRTGTRVARASARCR